MGRNACETGDETVEIVTRTMSMQSYLGGPPGTAAGESARRCILVADDEDGSDVEVFIFV